MVVPTDLHRIYTQALLARRALKQDVALELYERAIQICKKANDSFLPQHQPTTQGLNDFLHEVSSILEEVGMTISTGKEETGSGKGWIVLANTDATEIALMATDYTPIEISYIRVVITEIVESYPENSLGSTRALTLTSRLASTFPKAQAEMVLASCVSRGWLRQSKRGRYSLAPRSLLELSTFLREEFEDYIYTCHRCSKIVQTGVKCQVDGCEAHIHESCLNSFKRHRGNTCPKCNTSFDQIEPSPLGEKAASQETDHFRTGHGKKRSGRPSRANDDDEEQDDEVELEEEEGAGGASQSQSQGGTQTQPDEEDAEDDATRPRRSGGNRPTWRTSSRMTSRRDVVPETQYDEE